MKRKFKSIIGYTILLACMIIPIMAVVAALNTEKDGLNSLEAVQVQILKEKFWISSQGMLK